jgi:hypothetical protein
LIKNGTNGFQPMNGVVGFNESTNTFKKITGSDTGNLPFQM